MSQAPTIGSPAPDFALPSTPGTISLFERVRTDAEKKRKIEQVWKSKRFSFPTLLDYSMDVARAYEVGPIPHSVIIDPQGNIHEVKIGFTPRIFEDLKRTADKVLGEDG